MAICAFCRTPVSVNAFVVCPVCETPYHADCWRANDNRCSVLGCPGSGERALISLVDENASQRLRSRTTAGSARITIPVGWKRRLDLGVGVFCGLIAWILMCWALLSTGFDLLPVVTGHEAVEWQQTALVIGLVAAAAYGIYQGLRHSDVEPRRLVYALAGYAVLKYLADLSFTAYQFGNSSSIPSSLVFAVTPAIAGRAGILIGGLWLTAGHTMLPAAIGALLGTYLVQALNFLGISLGSSSIELELGLLAVQAGMCIIPLLLPVPLREMIGALFAAVPAMAMMRLFQPSFLADDRLLLSRALLTAELLALPMAGFVHVRANLPTRVSSGSDRAELPIRDLPRLLVAALVAAAFVISVIGITLLCSSWFEALLMQVISPLSQLPILTSAQFPFLQLQRPNLVGATWTALLVIYASVFAVGRLARTGLVYGLYRILRFMALLALCCSIAILAERTLERALSEWPVLAPIGRHLLLMGYGLPVAAALLAIIFAIAYEHDQAPFLLISLAFAFWFIQMLVLAVVLAFLGGVVGLWAGRLLGPALSQRQDSIAGLPWTVALPLAGAYLGFFIGVGRALIKWLNKDLGMIVLGYRRLVRRYSSLVDTWIDRLLRLRAPWWATMGFAALSVFAALVVVRILKMAL